jgi:hypothetical protein
VFFTDTQPLTEHSGAAPNIPDLYECQIVLKAGKLACELTDLTPEHGVEPADVRGSILGASADGSSVYFVADGVLSEEPNSRNETATTGKPNLYLRQGATTTFIATLAAGQSFAEGDYHDWEEGLQEQPTRVSGNGQFLELMSEARLTGYDNRDRATGTPAAEVFIYDAASKRLSCASCDPTGVRPVGVRYNTLELPNGIAGGSGVWTPEGLVAANVPSWTVMALSKARHQPRYLNNEGRLFFNTANALVPQDSNGTQDVYEYEPPGVGDCSEASSTFSARSGGCVSLISSGSSNQESAFMDASESGDDAFFVTSAKLSPLDVDAAKDVYDAHVCTNAEPCIAFPTTQSPPCTTEASCKPAPTPQPSIFGAPSSTTFQGLGNPVSPVVKPAVKAKAKPKTRAQKLAAALKGCQKRPKKQRAGCVKQARQKYGPLQKTKGKKRGKQR